MNTALTQRDRDGDSWRETKANRNSIQMLNCAAITVHSPLCFFPFARKHPCLIGRHHKVSVKETSSTYLHTHSFKKWVINLESEFVFIRLIVPVTLAQPLQVVSTCRVNKYIYRKMRQYTLSITTEHNGRRYFSHLSISTRAKHIVGSSVCPPFIPHPFISTPAQTVMH